MRSQRKKEHIELALQDTKPRSSFSNIQLEPFSIPDFNLEDVDLSSQYLGKDFPYPIYINAMTGGSDTSYEINKNLARLARNFNLMMACGSQQIALDDPTFKESFTVIREENPQGFVVGNVSANSNYNQLNEASEMIKADAMQIHINVAQELTMDEGDRIFSHWRSNIRESINTYDKPIIVKEVGFGMSKKTVDTLIQLGVENIDVSGRGGTNFIQIENTRSKRKKYEYLETWGLTTTESLFQNKQIQHGITLLASGGVETPLDVVKCLVLGAKAVGLSKYFLKLSYLSEEEQILTLSLFIEDIKKIMLLVGAKNIEALSEVNYTYEK